MRGVLTTVVLAACVAVGGCRRQVEPPVHPAHVTEPTFEKVEYREGRGVPHDGTHLQLNYEVSGPRFRVVFGSSGTEKANMTFTPPGTAGGSGIAVDDGWAYVSGTFTRRQRGQMGYWPIIIRSTMAIGADGTDFVVDCTEPDKPWVYNRTGSEVKVYSTTDTTAPITVLKSGWSAQFEVKTSGTTEVKNQAIDNKNQQYVDAVNTAITFGLTQTGP